MKPKLLESMMANLTIACKSPRTCEAYAASIMQFLAHAGVPNNKLSREHIAAFINHLVHQRRLAPSTVVIAVVALRYFFEEVLHRPKLVVGLTAPRVTVKPIEVLSIEEVTRLLEGFESVTHYTIASLLYGTGMRLSEGLAVTELDIDDARGVIVVPYTKNRQSRVARLSRELVQRLRTYWRVKRPKSPLLFHGVDPTRPMNVTAVERAFKAAAAKANLRKRVTPHIMRHSHATHLLEAGVDLYTVKQLLGHRCIESTVRYLHVSTAHLSGQRVPLHPLLLPR
jgi:site-specific recombinase XerD